MATFVYNTQSFAQANKAFRFMEYQSITNQIIQTFDFNDIQKGIKHAKKEVVRRETISNEEKYAVIDDLFNSLIEWLKKEGKRV